MIWQYLIFCIIIFQSKNFTVVNVQGKAFVTRNNQLKEIILGSTLLPEDKVQFVNNAGAIRLAGQGGTFILKSQVDPRTEKANAPKIWTSLREVLLPTKVSGQLKSRGGIISNQTEAENYFSTYQIKDNPMLVLDTLLVPVSDKYISDTANRFFYVSYKKANEVINKRIPFKTKGAAIYLSFDRRLLLIDGKEMGESRLEDAKIYFFEKDANKSILISDFNIRFERFELIRPELCLVAQGLGINTDNKSEHEQGISQLLNYLKVYYGQTDESLFLAKFLPLLKCKK